MWGEPFCLIGAAEGLKMKTCARGGAMAIYGVGAYYDEDVSSDFIQNGLVGVEWGASDAPELQAYFRSLKVGDIVYIKSAFQNPCTTRNR